MNTVQLECFIAVAEYLNFSKASRELKISQPAVSHQIQTLEEELTVRLFNRTSKSVTLTPEGAMFLADAHLILKTAFSAKERLGSRSHFTPLELGCHNYMELKLFSPVLHKLYREYPLLRPNLRLVPSPALFGMIENGQIHAALGLKNEQKQSSLFFRELCSAPICCICSPEHPLAAHDTLTSEMLTGNFIACSPRLVPDIIFKIQSGILSTLRPNERFFSENIESAFALAKALMGYTLYPDIPGIRENELRYIPVTDFPKIAFGIYYRYDQLQPELRHFINLMVRNMKDLQNNA